MPTHFFSSKLPNTGKSIFSEMSARANEAKAINLSQGFPNFDCDPVLIDLVFKYMNKGRNQYAPMAGTLEIRQAIKDKVFRHRNIEINTESEICLTAGATQAIYTAISAIIRPSDEVICIDPSYDSYKPSIAANGGIAVAYALKGPNYRINWDKIEALISNKTKLFILNNPHNPIGTTYSREDLTKLSELAEKYNFLVISDEVYEHLVFDKQNHVSALDIPALRKRSFICYSFGKTFHITGWKMGYCIAAPELMTEFKKLHQFTVFSVNTPAQLAIAEYLTKDSWKELPEFFQNKRDLLIDKLEQSPLKIMPCEGTYFLNVDYSDLSNKNDYEYAIELIEKIGVATIPLSVFYDNPPNEKLLRICFAKTDELIEAAGRQFQKL
jgi:methionine aminotransferase